MRYDSALGSSMELKHAYFVAMLRWLLVTLNECRQLMSVVISFSGTYFKGTVSNPLLTVLSDHSISY